MMLVEITKIAQAALPIAYFKEHLRLGSGFTDNALQDATLETALRAAIAAIEARTGKVLLERDFSWTLEDWRDDQRQPLPLAPVSAIPSLTIIDAQGGEHAVADGWRLEPDMQRPLLVATGNCLPGPAQFGRLRIVMLAGFGPDWGDLPADLAQATLLLAAHYYEFRHEAAINGTGMPFGVSALIERYRTVRLFGGGRS